MIYFDTFGISDQLLSSILNTLMVLNTSLDIYKYLHVYTV